MKRTKKNYLREKYVHNVSTNAPLMHTNPIICLNNHDNNDEDVVQCRQQQMRDAVCHNHTKRPYKETNICLGCFLLGSTLSVWTFLSSEHKRTGGGIRTWLFMVWLYFTLKVKKRDAKRLLQNFWRRQRKSLLKLSCEARIDPVIRLLLWLFSQVMDFSSVNRYI